MLSKSAIIHYDVIDSTNLESKRIIDKEYKWKEWAYPKTSEGKLNYDIALTEDNLLEFVNKKLL